MIARVDLYWCWWPLFVWVLCLCDFGAIFSWLRLGEHQVGRKVGDYFPGVRVYPPAGGKNYTREIEIGVSDLFARKQIDPKQ